MTPTRLVLLAHAANAPSPWMTLSAEGAVLQRGELAPDRPADLPPMRTVVVVPGADVLVRWLVLPTRNTAQAEAAAAWMLQDELAAPRDRLRVVLGEAPPPGEPRMAAVVNVALLEAWTDHLAMLGLKPDVLTPDCLTLPEPQDGTVLALRFGPGLALRGRGLALTCDPGIAEVLLDGRVPVGIEDPEAVDRLLAAAALAPPINLLKSAGLRRGGEGWRAWRRAAVLAAVLVVSPLLLWSAEAGRMEIAARDLNRQSEAAMRAAWTDVAPGVAPADEVRRRLAAGVASDGFAGVVAGLFEALEQVEAVELQSLALDSAGSLQAGVRHARPADLEALNAALAASGLKLDEQGSQPEGDRTLSDIVIVGADR